MATIRTTSGEVFVTVSPLKVAEFMRDRSGPVVRHMLVDGEKVKLAAIELAPKKTGKMANHIVKRFVVQGGLPAVLVGIDTTVVPYAIWVHEGAPAHDIFPRNAPRLVFFSQKAGKVIFMPVGAPVHHPGNKPNRFLLRALRVLRD